MGKLAPVSIGRGSKEARQGLAGLARFENAYVEDLGQEGKASFTAQCINGWTEFCSMSAGSVDKALPVGSSLLTISNNRLYSVSGAGTATLIGGIPGTGFITMAVNRKTPDPQVAIVRDGLWWYVVNGTLTQGSDINLPTPLCVVEILGYFVFLIRDGRFFISENNDITVAFDPTQYAEAESSSDHNVMAAVRGRTLIIFGERSTEFWDVNGNATFPFGFTTALSIGCFAAGSVANLVVQDNGSAVDTVIWAATDRNGAYAGVQMLNGYTPKVISTAAVDRAIRDETDKTSIRSMAWTEDGHPFYAIFGSTFYKVYDGKTNEWHDRKSRGLSRWNAQCHAQFDGKTLFGHQSNGKLYESRADLTDEAGDVIVFRIQPPPVHMFPRRFKVSALYLDMITGVGINSTTDDDANPTVIIDYSKDGGDSWAVQRRVSLGATAERFRRVVERQLGRFDHNGLTLRFTATGRTVRAIQQLTLDVEPLGA